MRQQPNRKPQLVRKRAIVSIPNSVKIVVQPSKNLAASLQQVKQASRQNVSKPIPVKKPPPVKQPEEIRKQVIANAVSKKRQILNKISKKRSKATKVRYVTRNVSPEDTAKANALRGRGRGKVLIIIGNGPSIGEMEVKKLLGHKNIQILSINKPDNRLWPTDYWAFYDGSQIRRHENLWTNYQGTIFNSTSIKKRKPKTIIFKNIGGKGFSLDAGKGIHIGRSSVYASMQIALWMEFDKIYILGCDMNPEGIDGKLHFYGENPDVPPEVRKHRFKDEATHYEIGSQVLNENQRNKFVFCSDYNNWGFIDKFQSMSHKVAVNNIVKNHGDHE